VKTNARTEGKTEATECIIFPANAVGNDNNELCMQLRI